MNSTFTRLFACLLCVGAASIAMGQDRSGQYRSAAYNDYYRGLTQPSPSDVIIGEGVAANGESSYKGEYGKDGCGCGPVCGGGCSDPCEPWRLFPEYDNGVTITGWANAGVTANDAQPASRYNGPMTFNDRNEGQLNQLYMVFERGVDNCGCGWDYGGRLDVLFGTDYIFTQQVGWETTDRGAPKWNNRSHYGLAMPQAYFEVAYNDVSVKIGRFYTIIGYESVMAPQNFFYSHAYTMQYGEPFTHTGALATWDYSDTVDIMAGLINGWNRFDGEDDPIGGIFGFTYAPCHDAYTIGFSTVMDHAANPIGTEDDRWMYSLVFTYNVSDNVQYVLQHDNGWHNNGARPAGQDAEWYGLNQYLFYTINECWMAGARFEWFRDDDGVRVAGIRAGNPNAGPFVGDFYEISLGLNWSPCENVRVRPELRWDWFEGTGLPYDDGADDSQFTAAMDAILLF